MLIAALLLSLFGALALIGGAALIYLPAALLLAGVVALCGARLCVTAARRVPPVIGGDA